MAEFTNQIHGMYYNYFNLSFEASGDMTNITERDMMNY